MNKFVSTIIRVYSYLLRLYPLRDQQEFEEQMLLDFSDLATDASKDGNSSLLIFCLRELLDFPVNLLQAHLRKDGMSKILHSKPVNTSLQLALGFGLAYFLSTLISNISFQELSASDDSIVGYLMLYYFELFHTTNGQQVVNWIPVAVSSLCTGLILGTVFTVFLEDRSEYPRFIFAVAISWYLHSAIQSILWFSADLWFFLGAQHSMYLDVSLSILSYAFLGLMFVIVKSKTGEMLRFLLIGAVGYPLFAFIYVRLLLHFLIIETPWMFIALMALIVVYMGSVIVVVLKSAHRRGAIWTVLAGVIVFRLVPYLISHIPIQWLSFADVPYTLYYDDPMYWQLMFKIAVQSGIYGIPLGLILGFVLELLNRRKLPNALA